MSSKARQSNKALAKYLERHAEPEAGCASVLADMGHAYAAVVVIPAYGEEESLRRALASIPACRAGRVLTVLVINERDDSPRWAKDANRIALDTMRVEARKRGEAFIALGMTVEFSVGTRRDLVLIDRTQDGSRLPSRQGVGLARKIGADFALALGSRGAISSPWIHCTDADVELPDDYFDRAEALSHSTDAAALIYDFVHRAEARHDLDHAVYEYELYLRYFILGLRSAGSPYAFHTIGSTIAVHAHAYSAVRGFPKREAAEDFHLLAKLAKVGSVVALRGEPIVLSGRESERVPFGTGRAMLQSRARSATDSELRVYDPRCFVWLGIWLDTLTALSANRTLDIEDQIAARTRGTTVDAAHLCRILEQMGALQATRKLLLRKGDTLRSLNENFDALAILKLIHAVRDEVHPDIALPLALANAPFCEIDPKQSFAMQCLELARIERDSDRTATSGHADSARSTISNTSFDRDGCEEMRASSPRISSRRAGSNRFH